MNILLKMKDDEKIKILFNRLKNIKYTLIKEENEVGENDYLIITDYDSKYPNNSKALNIITLSKGEELEIIKHYEIIFKLKNIFNKKNNSLFLFGSAGRHELNKNSDIDLFLLSDLPFTYFEKYIYENYNNVIKRNNEFIFTYDNIVIELYIIRNIEEAKLYYSGSEIINIEKTILIDNHDIKEGLYYINSKSFNSQEKILSIKEEIKYFTASLQNCIDKNDEYRYFFHVNIIIHNIIILKSIISGNRKFLYLPKYSKELLSSKEWNIICYKIGENMQAHINNIKNYVTDLLESINKEEINI